MQMKCSSCNQEQIGTQFCTQCGVELTSDLKSSVRVQTEAMPEGEQSNLTVVLEPAKDVESEAGLLCQQQTTSDEQIVNQLPRLMKPLFIWSVGIPGGFVAMSLVIAFACALLSKRSQLIEDYTLLFLTKVLELPYEIALNLASKMEPTLWHALIAAHGGSWKGRLHENSSVENVIIQQFELRLPSLILVIVLFLIYVSVFRWIKSRLHAV